MEPRAKLSTEARAAIVGRIERGESLEDIARALRPAADQEALRRGALVRSFDEELFNAVLAGKEEPRARFSELVKSDAVEAVPRLPGSFRVKASERTALLQGFWANLPSPIVLGTPLPESLRALKLELASYYEAKGAPARHDLLYPLAFIDFVRAGTLFTELYAEADSVFDLARCHDLLQILDEVQTLGIARIIGVDMALQILFNEYRVYLDARSHFADELYRTGRFFERRALIEAFEAFLEDDSRWILELYAKGGMGKTMFLRWAIARRCVPKPDRILCARIDFDRVDPLTEARRPWELLAKLAEELNVQLPGGPFSSLLSEVREYREVLARASPGLYSSATEQGAFMEQIADRFAHVLREVAGNRPALLIADTLEEALLHQGADLNAFIGCLSSVRTVNPRLRVILAGRYDLMERLPALRERFGAEIVPYEIQPFSDDEARRYLVEKRKIKANDGRLSVAVKKAGGVPFKLALLGDVLHSRPDLTPEDIEAYPNIDLVYLIERVVERIQNSRVRWLLRYGVVPRRLTFSFLCSVMGRFLPAAMAGTAAYDDPARDLPETLERQRRAFPTGLALPGETEAHLRPLWNELLSYASGYSWVSQEAGAPDTLSFHQDVINPMRLVLRQHEAYRLLHEAALDYYERRAAADPSQWVRWTRESIYHAFQLRGAGAAEYWRTQMKTAASRGDAASRREIAAEIVGSEYVDEDNEPRALDDGGALIDKGTLAEAYYELARALIDLARESGDPTSLLWNDAGREIERAKRAQEGLETLAVSAVKMALADAPLKMHAGHPAAAADLLEWALGAATRDDERFEIELLLGDALAAMRRPAAKKHYASASNLARASSALPPSSVIVAAERLARELAAQDSYASALNECRRALKDPAAHDDSASARRLKLLYADALLRAGQASQLMSYLDFLRARLSAVDSIRSFYFEARGRRALGEPDEGQQLCKKGLDMLRRLSDGGMIGARTHTKLLAEGKEELGRCLAATLDIDVALATIDEARSAWSAIGRVEEGARCLLFCIEVHLGDGGDLREASGLVGRALDLPVDPRSDAWALARALQVEIFEREGRRYEAMQVAVDLFRRLPLPRVRARSALAAITGDPSIPLYWRELLAALHHITPRSARIEALALLERCAPMSKDWAWEPKRLDYLVKPGASDTKNAAPAERIRRALVEVDVLRVTNRMAEAVSLLKDLRTPVKESRSLVLLRELLRASDRLGEGARWPQFGYSYFDEFNPYEELMDSSPIGGAASLEHAERLLRRGTSRSVAVKLEWAERLLGHTWAPRVMAARQALATLEGPPPQETRPLLKMVPSSSMPLPAPRLKPPGVRRPAPPIPSEARLTLPEPAAAPQSTPPALETTSGPLEIRLHADSPEQIHVEVTGVPLKSYVTIDEYRILRALRGKLARKSEAISYDLVQLLRESMDDATAEMGQILFGGLALLHTRDSYAALDICLIIEPVELRSVPWELCRSPRERSGPHVLIGPPTTIYRAPGSSIYGHAPRPPVVLLIGLDARHTSFLFDVYSRLGLAVRRLDIPSTSAPLREVLAELQPGVIHMSARFRESSSRGGVGLDLGHEQSNRFEGTDSAFSAISLAKLVRMASREWTPLLIVDALTPEGDTEAIRQLLLRNAYAAEYFEMSDACPVIAMGPTAPGDGPPMYEAMIAALAGEATIREVGAVIRSTSPVALSRAVALFTIDPSDRAITRDPQAPRR